MQNQQLGEKIRYYRKKMGLSQTALAEKIFVTSQNLSKWENGLSNPDIWNLCRLADLLNVSCDYLLGRIDCGEYGRTLLAVDGGGTKTEFLLFTESGKVLKRSVFSGSNPNSCGMDKTLEVLKCGIDSMLAVNDNIIGIYMGISGCGNEGNRKRIKKFMCENYPNISFEIQSDLYNAIYTETPSKTYLSVICGTGSIVAVNMGGEIFKIGGYGYIFDEEYCGYELGKKAIYETLRYENGIGDASLIAELTEKFAGFCLLDSINAVYSAGKDYIASFSPIIFEAYDRRDKTAEKIIEQSLKKLSEIINFAIKRYGCEAKAVLAGGMTKRADLVIGYLKRYCPGVDFIIADANQIYGAALYCCRQFGRAETNFTENLKNNLK